MRGINIPLFTDCTSSMAEGSGGVLVSPIATPCASDSSVNPINKTTRPRAQPLTWYDLALIFIDLEIIVLNISRFSVYATARHAERILCDITDVAITGHIAVYR